MQLRDPGTAMLRIVCFLLFALSPATLLANPVSEIRLVGDLKRTRLVVDLAAVPEFAVLRLTNPYRLVIDMPNVEFGPATPGAGRGLVTDFRYGLIAPGKARIVLDLVEPADVIKSFVLEPVGAEPARLVLDLEPTTAENFAAAAMRDRPPEAEPRVNAAEMGPHRSRGAVVVIDPGHGGIDSGAVGADGLLEKDVTLAFSSELVGRLKSGGKVDAILTRSDDSFVGLGDRVEMAQQHAAMLFISVHADSVNEDYVRGATVYTLSDDASDSLAAALAARENRSDVLAGFALDEQPDEVADILFDLARRETKNLSVRIAKSLVADLDGTLPLNKSPWRRASFRVLKAPEIPSVLLELGYLSNKEDEKLFRTAGWEKGSAEKVARAIEQFAATGVAGQ